METYAVRLLPRGECVERHLCRADAERYVETFNRVMRPHAVRAELVPEPAEGLRPTEAAMFGIMSGDRVAGGGA